ncbi:MAG: hypothetical protein H7644_06795 [Candidatus Heimdallarchaeota archaeon]|nr:hypothetical protein [Candidatus Heimdallarchaeota archaeon]
MTNNEAPISPISTASQSKFAPRNAPRAIDVALIKTNTKNENLINKDK